MALQSQLLLFYPFFFVFLFFIPCYTCLRANPFSYNYNAEECGYYSGDYPSYIDTTEDYYSGAYPSYIDTTEDCKFMELIKMRSDVLSLKKFNKVGSTSSSTRTVSVDDFGAKADGTHDDTEAFEKAWKEACSYEGAVLVIPKNSYLVKPIKFSGPCKSNLTVQIYGSIEASSHRSDYEKDGRNWLMFDSVEDLLVEGGGTINGNGKIWWENSCKINKSLPCKDAPTALNFHKCKNLVVKKLKVQNGQQIHVSFQGSINVQVSDLTVTSPGDSPNTDGIHITETQNIQIANSVIETGDDCISIVSGSKNVEATDITCGPGHGISIGSLGKGNSEEYVSGVTVNGAKLSGTANGVRIKTWQGGSGSASNIKFQNIEMNNVTNPIIIDQNYCDQNKPCRDQSSAVQVKNVVYKNIKGTSASEVAINLSCSKTHPCEGILLEDIKLEREGGETGKAQCNNVKLAQVGVVSPHCSST